MGYAYYLLPDGREAGYGVAAICDRDSCVVEIDRGLAWLCGRTPNGHRSDEEWGCGDYYCGLHKLDHDCPNPRCHFYLDDVLQTWVDCENGTHGEHAHACADHRALYETSGQK